MSDDDEAFFGMALLAVCFFLAALFAKTQGEKTHLLTQLEQCEARNE